MSAWYYLLRAHDHLWADRHWPLIVRIEACRTLMQMASQIRGVFLPWSWKDVHGS